MLDKALAAAAAAIMVAALAATPADAARKQKPAKPDASSPTSLDGRVTGRPRTCGYDTFQYDTRGVPVGPYCH
jgi:hypothetical protein